MVHAISCYTFTFKNESNLPNLPSGYTKNEFIPLIKINEHELNLCFLFSLNIMKLIDVILTFNYVYKEATFFSILKCIKSSL